MTLSEFITEIKDWLNRQDYSDATVTGWVRMMEQDLSRTLRCRDMIQIDTAVITENRVELPSDWQETDFIHVLPDGKPLHWVDRDRFFSEDNNGKYTVIGRVLFIGGEIDAVDGLSVELSYYGDIPALGDTSTWFMDKYHTLALLGTLAMGSLFGIEDERAVGMAAKVVAMVDDINALAIRAGTSGSRISRKAPKGFG